jgi:hypothetical protein
VDGVYEIVRGTDRIRLIVLSQIRDAESNRIWELFSGVGEHIRVAAQDLYRQHSQASTILNQLLEYYQIEGVHMPYTMEDFQRDFILDHLHVVSPEELLERLPPEELLK